MSECRCKTESEALLCRRAGTTMHAPLWRLCQQSAAHRELWDGLPPVQEENEPELTEEQGKSFLAWAGDLTKLGARAARAYRRWFAAGRPRPTPDQLAERKAACEACPHLQRAANEIRCGLCGCPIDGMSFLFGLAERPGKAEMSTEVCPDSPPRWKPLL